MNDPEVCSDHVRYMQVARAKGDMEAVALAYRRYRSIVEDIPIAEEMLGAADADERELAQEELETLKRQKDEIEEKIRLLLLPKDPNDDKDVIVEIRAAAGGEEAKLFAGELYRMYSRYAERRKWKTELIDIAETGIGGILEVTFEIDGQGAYSQLKFEGGVHRVQRVPVTESAGRI